MPISAVLFDLDDTLVVDEAVSRETFAAVAKDAFTMLGSEPAAFIRAAEKHARRLHADSPVYPYCKRIGISAFECLWGKFEGDSPELTSLREWSQSYRQETFDAALRHLGLDGSEAAEELAAAFSDHRRRLQRLMPDAREILARLKPKARLGLLTNGAPDLQREKITASGLGPCFDAIAISGEHGIGKPNPEIFFRLLDELKVRASDAVMVGNSLERDIQGAKNAGIRSVWIQIPGSEEPADVLPDHTIQGLAEIPALLESLAHPATAGVNGRHGENGDAREKR